MPAEKKVEHTQLSIEQHGDFLDVFEGEWGYGGNCARIENTNIDPPELRRRATNFAGRLAKSANYHERLVGLARHISAVADDAYLLGHPEWAEIAAEAEALLKEVEEEK